MHSTNFIKQLLLFNVISLAHKGTKLLTPKIKEQIWYHHMVRGEEALFQVEEYTRLHTRMEAAVDLKDKLILLAEMDGGDDRPLSIEALDAAVKAIEIGEENG